VAVLQTLQVPHIRQSKREGHLGERGGRHARHCERGMKPPLDITEALAELTLTIHALRTNEIEPPRDCRRRAAAAFIMAACGQLDSKGALAAYREPRHPSPHGAERDWR